MMPHVALLGDSIFDNRVYVPGKPAVIDQVRAKLPDGARATLLAVDGSTTVDIERQVRRLPLDVTHIVLSVGGNDALEAIDRLSTPVSNILDGLELLSAIKCEFAGSYRAAWRLVRETEIPVIGCTIYDSVPGLSDALKTALSIYNDAIVREIMKSGSKVIDLREICTDPIDYSTVSPIEPSDRGGDKIAAAIVGLI